MSVSAGRIALAAAVAALAFAAAPAMAQNFPDPNKTVQLILPFPPGGSVDTGFRIIAPAVEKALKTKVEVVNKGGGGGQSGITDFIRTAKPDGYMLVNIGLPTVPTQYLDPSRGAIYTRANFQPIAQAWSSAYGFAVSINSPIQNFQQFLAAAKEKGGKLTMGDPGLWTAPHVMAAIFQSKANIKLASVHFNGGAASMAALFGGHVEAVSTGTLDFTPALRNNTIRVLAMATPEPTPYPGVQAFTTLGVPLEFLAVQSVSTLAGTPMPIVRALEAAFRTALADPETQAKMAAAGSPADFLGVEAMTARWEKYEGDLRPVMAGLLEEDKDKK